ncbi:MAG: hypothetical protein LBI63_03555 [Candidatus Ancillula sp.]|jgi:hypothetical protein|nr:hypothetical protein [Candidatus Ancillula sp.]
MAGQGLKNAKRVGDHAYKNEDMRNFSEKITPLIAVFALVAFSIFIGIKLPAFAQNSVQDLNKTEVLCKDSASSGQSAQDLSKTEVSRGGSAGSAEHEQDNSAQSVPSEQQAQTNGVITSNPQDAQNSVITPLDTQTEQNQQVQDNCVQTPSAEQDLESNSPITHLNTQISAQVPLRVQRLL